MRNRRKRIKYKNFAILFVIIVVIIVLISFSFSKNNEEEVINDEFEGLVVSEVSRLCELQKLDCNFSYQYDDEILENVTINYKKINNKYEIVISKGPLTSEVLEEYKVNELGKVPIMMYHGIVFQEETKYIGGNVDKDGYNRTSSAFRNDLEFYYQNGYRMIRLIDYVNGEIMVPIGLSPIILTFDDGNENNFKVLGRDDNGNLIIDPNCAVGILEEFKRKYPDFNVTATFFLMNGLFNQSEYNEEIMHWLVNNGYDIGNHTINHADFKEISTTKTQEVVGKMYQKLESILEDKYVPIIALPYGSPYKRNHTNYPYILKGEYKGIKYETISALRVGWDSEVSPFNKSFDKTFLKRCRAYDNNGVEFDIEMVFKNLETSRYISDGNKETITIKEIDSTKLNNNLDKKVIKY